MGRKLLVSISPREEPANHHELVFVPSSREQGGGAGNRGRDRKQGERARNWEMGQRTGKRQQKGQGTGRRDRGQGTRGRRGRGRAAPAAPHMPLLSVLF